MYGALETESDPPGTPPQPRQRRRSRRHPHASSSPSGRLPPRFSRPLLSGGGVGRSGRLGLGTRGASVMGQLYRNSPHAAAGGVRSRRSAAVESSTATGAARHSFVYTLLNPRSHRWQAELYKRFMTAVILVDLCSFVASTEPRWEGHPSFYVMEGVSSTVFLIEYMARLATVTESKRFHKYGPALGRLRYMVTFPAIIDALATFPFFLELCADLNLPTLTYLRVFRLLRILKTEGFVRAFDSVERVIYYNREILYVVSLLCIFLILITAVAMYYLRPKKDLEDAADFSSILATMYLSTLMLTGQGGPEGDLPWYTRLIVIATGVFSVAMFAIPASMFTWGFEAEAQRLAMRTVKRSASRAAGMSTSSSSSSEGDAYCSSSSIDTSDEEYQRIIAGDDDDGGGEGGGAVDASDAKSQVLKEILEVFDRADGDGSGNLNKEEFVKMVEPLLSEATAGDPPPEGAGAGGSDDVRDRVGRLEAKVDEMNEKLDRLLNAVKMSERW